MVIKMTIIEKYMKNAKIYTFSEYTAGGNTNEEKSAGDGSGGTVYSHIVLSGGKNTKYEDYI